MGKYVVTLGAVVCCIMCMCVSPTENVEVTTKDTIYTDNRFIGSWDIETLVFEYDPEVYTENSTQYEFSSQYYTYNHIQKYYLKDDGDGTCWSVRESGTWNVLDKNRIRLKYREEIEKYTIDSIGNRKAGDVKNPLIWDTSDTLEYMFSNDNRFGFFDGRKWIYYIRK
jgi:hypothetical protein